jgi:hypothetical protein
MTRSVLLIFIVEPARLRCSHYELSAFSNRLSALPNSSHLKRHAHIIRLSAPSAQKAEGGTPTAVSFFRLAAFALPVSSNPKLMANSCMLCASLSRLTIM